jgi:WD40 repeat protein
MPIHEFASRTAGTFFEVEGVVEFNPAPNGKYKVSGSLSKITSAVWIEDLETHEIVTEKVLNR